MERPDESLLGEEELDAANYVRRYLEGVREGEQARRLASLRSKMNAMNAETMSAVKKNVSLNYKQFIDTSKQISHLENEIYQLSFLLTEQKTLIEQMLELTGESSTKSQTLTNGLPLSAASKTSTAGLNFQNLIHKIDGIAVAFAALDSSDVELILEGELTVLDDSLQPTGRLHLTLLTDRILFSKPTSSPSQSTANKWRYQLQSSHSLNALAAVNVKDPDERLNAFKLLIFPEQYYLGCESAKMKHDWLEAIDRAKNKLLQSGSLVRQATIRGKRNSYREAATKRSSTSTSTINMNNDHHQELRAEVSLVSEGDELAWLKELPGELDVLIGHRDLDQVPGELDVLIGHRDLDQAVEMLLEARAALADGANTTVEAEIRIRERRLIELLSEQVRRPGGGGGAAAVGPRGAARKAVALLRALGRGGMAIELYLKRRSAGARASVKELRVSEEPLRYVRELCQLFINNTVLDVVKELSGQSEHGAVILQWASQELSVMLSLIRRHVIELAPSMAVLAHSWRIVQEHCGQLPNAGLDLSFQLNRLLAPAVLVSMDANFKNLIDALRMRFNDDKWTAYVLEPESSFNRFLEEMADLGLRLDWAIKPGSHCALLITATGCHFARVAISLAKDLSQLRSTDLVGSCDGHMLTLWMEMLNHLIGQRSSPVRDHTATFIAAQVLPLCETMYASSDSGHLLSDLLMHKFASLASFSSIKSSSSSSTAAVQFEDVGQV